MCDIPLGLLYIQKSKLLNRFLFCLVMCKWRFGLWRRGVREGERGAREAATKHSDENTAHTAPFLHHHIISDFSLVSLIQTPPRSVFQHRNIGSCACEQQEWRRTPRVRPAPHRHATGRSSVSHSRIQPQHVSELQPCHLRPGLDNRSIGTARFSFVDIITR